VKVEVLEHPEDKDWLKVKRRALVTIGKTPLDFPNEEWKIKMLRCRHSPIRYLRFSFYITDIPYWLSTELCRHHVGCEKFVRSQRDDRNTSDVPRAEKPQGALVNMILDINAEALLTLMNKRLCGAATKEMQELMLLIREQVIWHNLEFKDFLVPMCEYIHCCNEFNSCCKKALYFER
jgi:thymidylate synthase ThyX